MVITEVFYGVKCNRCDRLYGDGEHSFWNDENYVVESSVDGGWFELNGKHYCCGCHKMDDDTNEVKIFEEYPQSIKTLNSFIDKILKCVSRDILEYDDNFTIIFRLYNRSNLELSEINYIKSLFGDKFVSLDNKEARYNSFLISIKIDK